MTTRDILSEIIRSFARYTFAILVTLLLSVAVSFVAVTVLDYDLILLVSGANSIGVTVQCAIPSITIVFIATFAGLFLGSLCLPRHGRRLGCIVLTILGVMTFQIFWYTDWQYEVISKHGNSSDAPMILFGGICAYLLTVLCSFRKPKGRAALGFALVVMAIGGLLLGYL